MKNSKIINDLKSNFLVPYILTLVGGIFMFLTIFLPYATATDEYLTNLNKYPDLVLDDELDITSKDIINVSMIEYAKIYNSLSEDIWGNSSYGVLYIVIVVLIGLFSGLVILFVLLKKPIGIIIFNLLGFGIFSLQRFDYIDRGVIPSLNYNWGIAYYIFYIAFIMVLIGAIWMFIYKISQKKN